MTRSILFLISSLGIVIFLFVTAIVPFKSQIFNILYGKPLSQATEGPNVPLVELFISDTQKKHINFTSFPGSVNLTWKTSNVKSCVGRAFGISEADKSWAGPKDINGGSFELKNLTGNNAYIYLMDCANEFGDGAGDGVVINVGAPTLGQFPYIASLEVRGSSGLLNPDKPITFVPGGEMQIRWSALNLNTPYSVCLATGSWPTQYQNFGKSEVFEKFTLDIPKVYRYSLFCSNEAGITRKTVTFSP